MIPELPFSRTVCGCTQCVDCCKRQPGPLIPGDYERITAYLGVDAKQFLVASKGATVLTGDGVLRKIGTITPKYEHGKCVFLTDDNQCLIHPVAPAGCAYFDTHMYAQEGQKRGAWLIKLQLHPSYQALRSTLPFSTHHQPQGY